ncbi:hypothetical protein NP493_399g00001 [Ridgeia piscesae]|uniref:Uncharacterized protein n=1 Tax=Ridgeia piscesae TaxID=27915 RepID=A0AAD9L140_RIDPI|nr:hypothetical protein NP493_399g00001 [Ridgeia piscesae]
MSTDAWGNKGTTIDDVVNDVSTNEFVLDSAFIAAVAFRKEATYPGCSLCRRRVQPRENGFTCASHGARDGSPTYRYMVRVLLGQVDDTADVIVITDTPPRVDHGDVIDLTSESEDVDAPVNVSSDEDEEDNRRRQAVLLEAKLKACFAEHVAHLIVQLDRGSCL